MGERHAYGTSFGCVSRRIFILLLCAVLSLVCIGRIVSWFLHWAFQNKVPGRDTLLEQACYGMECYEVFTCRGFSWTTQHIREPLTTLCGAIIFPMGFVGALHGYRDNLKLFATFISILAAVYVGCLVGDVIYYETCSAYPANVIYEALLWPISFPIRAAAQQKLRSMSWFPEKEVNDLTGNFSIWTWYILWMSIQCIFLCYAAWEARMLGMLVERGPLGLGVHYGLGQWDEIINHETFKKRREPKSKFVEDGRLPLTQFSDPEEPFGYMVGHNYGAFHAVEGQIEPSKKFENWQERMMAVNEAVEEAREEYRNKQEELKEAQNEVSREKGLGLTLEEEAERNFRQAEVDEEKEEERRAEELAQDAYERKRKEAEQEGKSRQEAIMLGTMAYQRTLREYHKDMIRLAKARTLHEHYRHAERQKTFTNKGEEISHKVQDSMAQLSEAELRLQKAEQLKQSLEQEKVFVQSGQWDDAVQDSSANLNVGSSQFGAYPESAWDSFDIAPTVVPASRAPIASTTLTTLSPSIVSPPATIVGPAAMLGTSSSFVVPPPTTMVGPAAVFGTASFGSGGLTTGTLTQSVVLPATANVETTAPGTAAFGSGNTIRYS